MLTTDCHLLTEIGDLGQNILLAQEHVEVEFSIALENVTIQGI